MQPVDIRRDARCSALLVLLVLLFCAAAAWLAVRYPGGSGLDASAVSWASNGISESSSGRLFKAVKVRSYQGVRRFASFEGMAAPRPPRLHGGRACKNWAVTTTIFPPTTTVKQLAALPSWCLVVAGDKKGPPASAYNLTGVVYLTPAMQDALPFETGRHLRWNHFGRKNLGFLYAVAHGANWVYDTDDDNELQRAGERAIPLPRGGTLLDELASSHHLANLYPQMSDAPGSWPRGFPLDAIKDNRTRELPLRPRAWPFRRVGVLQSLADHDPDVDGIYRLTQRRLPFTFPKRVDRVARRDRSLTAGAGAAARRLADSSGAAGAAGADSAAASRHPLPRARRAPGGKKPARKPGGKNKPTTFSHRVQPAASDDALSRPRSAAGAKLAAMRAKLAAKRGHAEADRGGGRSGAASGGGGGSSGAEGAGMVTLREGTMMPYNAQATLHTYDALWSLLLPISVHGRVTDIWRAYFAQRLMWDVGLRLAFALPWVTQYRNVHVLLGDFNSEVPLYQQAGALVDDLLAWQPRAPTLPGRIEELYVHMYERNIVGAKDVTLAQAWIADLLRLGYRFPALRQRARPRGMHTDES